jgi:2-oxoglutarate ferredoxin oxidoreductase subunit beta
MVEHSGSPIKMSELLATIPGAAYIERVSVHNPLHIKKAKQAVKKAFEMQLENKGFSLIEFISTCPVNWGMTPIDALKWAEENMVPYYPLGVYKDVTKEAKS